MFVLDASVSLASLLEQPEAVLADPIIVRMSGEGAYVPSHWALEITNILARDVRRGLIDAARAAALAQAAASWQVIVDDQTFTASFTRTLELAMAHGLTTYDAAYVELCLRLGAPLATFDGALGVAARSLGVSLLFGAEPSAR